MQLIHLLVLLSAASAQQHQELHVIPPLVVLSGVPFDLTVQLPQYYSSSNSAARYPPSLNFTVVSGDYILGSGSLDFSFNGSATLTRVLSNVAVFPNNSGFPLQVHMGALSSPVLHLTSIPGVLSILPPLLTMLIAVFLRQVLLALLCGVWVAASCVQTNPGSALLSTFSSYWVNAMSEGSHASVILFTLLLGGFIGIVQKGGGAQALTRGMGKFMTTVFRAELALALLVLVVFIDDFAGILIVGSALRGVMDLGVQKQRYAFILHTIAVCTPSFAPVSSWVGVEVGYLSAAYASSGLDGSGAFTIVLSTIPLRILPVTSIFFVFMSILLQRDFGGFEDDDDDDSKQVEEDSSNVEEETVELFAPEGAMREKEAVDPLAPIPGKPQRSLNAVIPIVLVILLVFVGMIVTGLNSGLKQITIATVFANAKSNASLIWATTAGCFMAAFLLLLQRILKLSEVMDAWLHGLTEVVSPTLIMILAWALGDAMEDLGTSRWLVSVLGGSLPAMWLPLITAILCMVIGFATGSSFGTMGIVFPLIIPLAAKLSNGDIKVVELCAASILGNSIYGNLCSPLADTSIVTVAAVKTTLPKHVKAVFPYITFLAINTLLGYLWLALGLPDYLALVPPLLVCILSLLLFGAKRGQSSPVRRLFCARKSKY